MTADDLIDALAELLLPRLVSRLAMQSGTKFYSTVSGQWPPLAKSRRHARDLIRRVPGHEQIGAGSLCEWRVSIVAFGAHMIKKSKPRPPLALVPAKALTAEMIAERALERWRVTQLDPDKVFPAPRRPST